MLLEVRELSRRFPAPGSRGRGKREEIHAVDSVSFDLDSAETLGVVGESGSGKTTLARCLMRLCRLDGGSIRLDGEDLVSLRGEALRRRRRDFQMVAQDSQGSLNPRLRIGEALAEVLRAHGVVSRQKEPGEVGSLLERVGLGPEIQNRYPGELSGGQRQRVAIARSLATRPRLLIADEPVSALDASVQGQVLNLLARLQSELGLAMLLVAHDLAVVEQLADRVAVLVAGRFVEVGPTHEVFSAPRHPYTLELLSAARGLSGATTVPPEGEVDRARGCVFRSRCSFAIPECSRESPALLGAGPGHVASCHREREVGEAAAETLWGSGAYDD